MSFLLANARSQSAKCKLTQPFEFFHPSGKRISAASQGFRSSIVRSLQQVGVPTAVHYPMPLHEQPAYKPVIRVAGALDVSERVSHRVLSLPMHPYLDEPTMQTIVHALGKAAGR